MQSSLPRAPMTFNPSPIAQDPSSRMVFGASDQEQLTRLLDLMADDTTRDTDPQLVAQARQALRSIRYFPIESRDLLCRSLRGRENLQRRVMHRVHARATGPEQFWRTDEAFAPRPSWSNCFGCCGASARTAALAPRIRQVLAEDDVVGLTLLTGIYGRLQETRRKYDAVDKLTAQAAEGNFELAIYGPIIALAVVADARNCLDAMLAAGHDPHLHLTKTLRHRKFTLGGESSVFEKVRFCLPDIALAMGNRALYDALDASLARLSPQGEPPQTRLRIAASKKPVIGAQTAAEKALRLSRGQVADMMRVPGAATVGVLGLAGPLKAHDHPSVIESMAAKVSSGLVGLGLDLSAEAVNLLGDFSF